MEYSHHHIEEVLVGGALINGGGVAISNRAREVGIMTYTLYVMADSLSIVWYTPLWDGYSTRRSLGHCGGIEGGVVIRGVVSAGLTIIIY